MSLKLKKKTTKNTESQIEKQKTLSLRKKNHVPIKRNERKGTRTVYLIEFMLSILDRFGKYRFYLSNSLKVEIRVTAGNLIALPIRGSDRIMSLAF